MRLDKFILQHCHTCDSFIFKSLKTGVEGFLTDKTEHKGTSDQYVISFTLSPTPRLTRSLTPGSASLLTLSQFQCSPQGHNLNQSSAGLKNKLNVTYSSHFTTYRIVTCLVKSVCTEDKSRPRSSDRAIPSLSPKKTEVRKCVSFENQ